MWLLYAVGSSFFAGITAILVKIGVEDTDSHLLTALRTIVVLIFSWIMVFVVGSQGNHFRSIAKDAAILVRVRNYHRGILDLLFPRIADRRCQ